MLTSGKCPKCGSLDIQVLRWPYGLALGLSRCLTCGYEFITITPREDWAGPRPEGGNNGSVEGWS